MSTDKIREEFEAWYFHPSNLDAEDLEDLRGPHMDYRIGSRTNECWSAWQAATQATARRCVEIVNDERLIDPSDNEDFAYNSAIRDIDDAITREFGLEEKP